jgi:transposase
VDERGAPLSLVVAGANRHDSVLLEPLLAAMVAVPPKREEEEERPRTNLCLDAGYVGKESEAEAAGMVPHIRPRGEEKLLIERNPEFKARRWVVECAGSWFNRFRKLVPRYEKTDLSYMGLTTLAAAMIVLNKVITIHR